MKAILSLLIVSCFALPASANDYLTPLDFGFGMLEHGRVDYCNPPPHTLAGNFNSDDYPDIARFDGNRLEIFISTSYGYSSDPQQVKTFDKPIASLGFGGTVWDTHPPLKVVFTDGTEELFYLRRGMLDLDGDVLSSPSPHPPRTISEADFQIVWESENYPHIANRATVGDLDNDGIIEVVTWWKESAYADTAWIDIYKVVGDNTYELWKREPLVFEGPNPGLSQLLITDVDRNGLKELVYTGEDAYFWEFDNAGNYQVMRSNFTFPRPVMDVKECDFDQDGIYEIASVGSYYNWQPPTAYNVWEFNYKLPDDSLIFFSSLAGTYLDRYDVRFDIGDVNNDGLQDIVTGTGQSWAGSEPLDVLYYSYNPASPSNFTENWIYTGLNMSCVSPVIGDFDGDTENELFFGGSWAGFSSVVLLDSPGDTAEIIWGDSIHAPSLASEGCFAVIDGAPAVVTTHILPSLPTGSHLALWTHIDGGFRFAWLSVLDDSAAYHDATVLDVDLDGKQNIIVASDIAHQIVDYEQPSSGIKGFGKTPGELEFALLPGYPNPFNGIITVPFELNKRADVRLSIYDITGRLVYSWQEENLLPGYYEVDWHAETEASGIYIFYLRSGEEVQTRKGVLLK